MEARLKALVFIFKTGEMFFMVCILNKFVKHEVNKNEKNNFFIKLNQIRAGRNVKFWIDRLKVVIHIPYNHNLLFIVFSSK